MCIKIYNLLNRIIAKIINVSKKINHYIFLNIENVTILFALFFFKIFFNFNKIEQGKKILICRNKFYGNKEDESLEKIHLEDTIKNFDIDLETFFWDIKSVPGTNLIRFLLILYKIKPNLIIFSSFSFGKKRPITQPKLYILTLFKKLNLFNNSIILWWDTCSKNFVKKNLNNQTPFDLHVIIDNPQFNINSNEIHNTEKNKIVILFCPYNINSDFYTREKEYNYSFIGQVDSYRSQRKEYIEYLIESKIDGIILAQNRVNQISRSEYAEILGKSKIGINFSFSVDQHQLKARVFEIILSGALLFESRNNQTSKLFDDNIDFISFGSKEELIDKINFYLINDSERNKIIFNAQKKIENFYNGINFWQLIFNKINLCIKLQS